MSYVPFLLDTDTYKTSHYLQYDPSITKIFSYFAFRKPLVDYDNRIVVAGIRYLVETILMRPITMADVEEADRYLETHGVMKSKMRWPRADFVNIAKSTSNRLIDHLEFVSLRDGAVVVPGQPVFYVTNKTHYAFLVNYFETQFMRIWSPSVTATKSRLVRDLIEFAFAKSVEPQFNYLIDSRLHDFGSRGVSSPETAMVTGTGHLLSFEGTDTMTAGWLATKWNNGVPVGESVMASEHSVMTSWPSEEKAMEHLIKAAENNSILSVVADSYNYANFCNVVVPKFVPAIREKGLFFVLRPDSGDTVEAVIDGLEALEKAFGATTNSLGYKVINGAGIIQGDGLDIDKIRLILYKVMDKGYSAQNVAFGMGGGLLQQQTRDSMSAAIKVCRVDRNEERTPIMKIPATDKGKISLPLAAEARIDITVSLVSVIGDGNIEDDNNRYGFLYWPPDVILNTSFATSRKILMDNWRCLNPTSKLILDEQLINKVKESIQARFSS